VIGRLHGGPPKEFNFSQPDQARSAALMSRQAGAIDAATADAGRHPLVRI
jgi:hypothetical protein